jgi:hypothetical protein
MVAINSADVIDFRSNVRRLRSKQPAAPGNRAKAYKLDANYHGVGVMVYFFLKGNH